MLVVSFTRSVDAKLGCRISPDNTVSDVTAGGITAAAGLRIGHKIMSVNGERCTLKQGASDLVAMFLGQGAFSFSVEVSDAKFHDEPAKSQSKKAKVTSSENIQPAAKKRKAATAEGAASPAATSKAVVEVSDANFHDGPAKAHSKKVKAPSPKSMRPAARKRKAASPAATSQAAAEAARLRKLIVSQSVDLRADILAKLDAADDKTVEFLIGMYPIPSSSAKDCVFCGKKFDLGSKATCTVKCNVDWTDFEEKHTGYEEHGGTHTGRCSICGFEHREHAGTYEAPRVGICYTGPHSSSAADLKAHRLDRISESEYEDCFRDLDSSSSEARSSSEVDSD